LAIVRFFTIFVVSDHKTMNGMKCSELIKLAKQNGWWYLKQSKGSHEVWTNGKIKETIPNHGSKELNKGTERKLRKRMGL